MRCVRVCGVDADGMKDEGREFEGGGGTGAQLRERGGDELTIGWAGPWPALAPCARQQSKHRDVMARTGTDLNYAALRCRTSPHGARTSELQSAFAECRRLTSRGAKGLSAAREEAQEFVLNVPRPRADCETSRRAASLLHQDLRYVGAGRCKCRC